MADKQPQREAFTQVVDRFIASNTPAQAHTLLITAYSRGKSGVPTGSIPVSYAKLVTEGHRAVTGKDMERAGRIAEYYTAVAMKEAMSIGLVSEGDTDEQMKAGQTVAAFYLNRGLPLSRILQTRDGGALLDQLEAGKLPWVQPAVLLKSLVLSYNSWVPEIPETQAEAEDLLDTGALKLAHPHMHKTLVSHVEQGTDMTWWALETAQDRVAKEVKAVMAAFNDMMVAPPVSAVSSVVDQFLGAVKACPKYAPHFVNCADDGLKLIELFAPDLFRAYNILV